VSYFPAVKWSEKSAQTWNKVCAMARMEQLSYLFYRIGEHTSDLETDTYFALEKHIDDGFLDQIHVSRKIIFNDAKLSRLFENK
jgi:hypothetical protein